MKKYLCIIFLLIVIISISGCSGNNIPEETGKNYTYAIGYAIGQEGGLSSVTPKVQISAINVNFDKLYAIDGQKSMLKVFKIYDDGRNIEAEGVWKYNSDNGFLDNTTDSIHKNFITINSKEQGIGQVSVLVTDENTGEQLTAEKNVYIYGTVEVSNYQNGKFPQTIDFSEGANGVDITFDGLSITANNSLKVINGNDLRYFLNIPAEGYYKSYDFDSNEELDIMKHIIVLKTLEGYTVKMFAYRCDGTYGGDMNIYFMYLIEKDPAATQFAY